MIPIANSLKLFNWPTTSRIFPTKLLYIAMKYLSDERFPKDGGIPPVRLFIEIKSLSSFITESSSAGIFPIRLFTMRFMNLRLEQLDKLDEISPFNVLLLRERFVVSINGELLLEFRHRNCYFGGWLTYERWGFQYQVIWIHVTYSPVGLKPWLFGPDGHVIPCQLQKCIESFHELNMLYGSRGIDSLNLSKTKWSVSFVGVVTVMAFCKRQLAKKRRIIRWYIWNERCENGIGEESLGLEKQKKLVKYFGVKLRQWVGLWSSIIVSYIGRSLSPKQHATHAKKKKVQHTS